MGHSKEWLQVVMEGSLDVLFALAKPLTPPHCAPTSRLTGSHKGRGGDGGGRGGGRRGGGGTPGAPLTAPRTPGTAGTAGGGPVSVALSTEIRHRQEAQRLSKEAVAVCSLSDLSRMQQRYDQRSGKGKNMAKKMSKSTQVAGRGEGGGRGGGRAADEEEGGRGGGGGRSEGGGVGGGGRGTTLVRNEAIFSTGIPPSMTGEPSWSLPSTTPGERRAGHGEGDGDGEEGGGTVGTAGGGGTDLDRADALVSHPEDRRFVQESIGRQLDIRRAAVERQDRYLVRMNELI
jgi:hypothetical protein